MAELIVMNSTTLKFAAVYGDRSDTRDFIAQLGNEIGLPKQTILGLVKAVSAIAKDSKQIIDYINNGIAEFEF